MLNHQANFDSAMTTSLNIHSRDTKKPPKQQTTDYHITKHIHFTSFGTPMLLVGQRKWHLAYHAKLCSIHSRRLCFGRTFVTLSYWRCSRTV